MSYFWSSPVLRSLMVGVFTVGGAMLFLTACLPGLYNPHVGSLFGLPHTLSRSQVITIAQIVWAWIALSIIGSYGWHTRYLDRTTRMGNLAYGLMRFQYVLLLLLALLLYIIIPNEAKPGNEPFFG